ncbi:hypothetical protein F3H64_24250 [Enterobacter hormaechei]|uniref:hypothetical protein n=1 Tax=Enterobacter hormaechei TaxID=158836 RepID=UPI001882AB59|nr:hypothetical protein [Enterobacter hormaechei]MBE8859819.1 hypothetical protein [Enterobacter hormaechei]
MCLGSYSGAGRLTITLVALLVSSSVHADAATAEGFGLVIQKAVEARETQFLASNAGRIVATGAQAGAMGLGIAVAAEIIRERPDVIDSYRMCGEMVGNVKLCTAESVFAAASGLAANKYGEIINNGMSRFGSNLVAAGQGTWGMLGNAAGIISLTELGLKTASKHIQYFTEGIKKDDGTYDILLPDGGVFNTSEKPTTLNPVAVSVSDGYQSFSPEKIKGEMETYQKDIKPVVLPDTFYNIPAPDPVSQPFPDGAKRVSIRGKSTPYYTSDRDKQGDFVVIGENPALIALYVAINKYKDTNAIYYENKDDYNKNIKIPSSFRTYQVSIKDFQYSGVNIISGGFPTDITVVYTVHETSVRLTNSRDICKSEKVQDGGTADKPAYSWKTICRPEIAQYQKQERTFDTTYNTVFFNTDYDTSRAPSIITGSVVDNIDGYDDEAPPYGDAGKLAQILNGLAGQAVTGENYKGIPLERPFTAADIIAAAGAAGVVLDSGILYQPVSVPRTWVHEGGKDTDTDYPDSDTHVTVDFGENPNTPAPALETPPTGEEILKPITELMPDIKNLSISSRDVQCPVWQFELWDNKYSIDSHCELLEKIRPLLKALFLLIWGIISLRIILTA